MKISVIFTGGTIASAEKNGVIAPTEQSGSFLLNSFSSYEENGVSFQPFYPYTVLSENLSAKHLNSLVGAVIERVNAGDDKIIICHGSDTLQYTAAAVSFALSGRNACVVFVCSDKPLQAPETNGFINFETAVEFLLQTDLKGVFAAYKNRGETPKILHGARLSSHLEGCDSLYDIFEKSHRRAPPFFHKDRFVLPSYERRLQQREHPMAYRSVPTRFWRIFLVGDP